MLNEQVAIHELQGGEVNILNAEEEEIQLTKTGIFICKDGEVTLSIDEHEYTMGRQSLITYFSYSKLKIVSHSRNLKGILIGADLELVQPILYQVTNFNAVFKIKQLPYVELTDKQYEMMMQHIILFSKIKDKMANSQSESENAENLPMLEINRKQIQYVTSSLILEILQCYTNDLGNDAIPMSRKDEIFQKFVTSLYKHYKTEHEVSFYAGQQYLTSRYFSAIIKEKSGKSPSAWISTALLVDAKKMVTNTNMSIKDISDTLHFPNQSYFGKWFKHLTGSGPLEFRYNRMLNKPSNGNDFEDVISKGLKHTSD